MKHQDKMRQMRQETFDYVNSEPGRKSSRGVRNHGSDRKIVLPNDYKHAWEGSDGKVVTSNNPSFNPNYSSDYSGNWSEIQKGSRFD
jgi:hypothetical protein